MNSFLVKYRFTVALLKKTRPPLAKEGRLVKSIDFALLYFASSNSQSINMAPISQ
ncbi:hypothetical protein ES708_20674 [subsurface metagenome]